MRDEFLITRQGKQYVLYAGLLDEAHSRGLRGIDTELVQVPTEENGNVAIVKAMAEINGEEGESKIFSGIGDASPANVGRNIVPHIIRMAETRAKARALRDAVNVGATSLEELSDEDGEAPSNVSSLPHASARDHQEERKERGSAQKARKSQIDLLRTLAEELRGEHGVERLESRIGKKLTELTRSEADEWIDRLAPAE